MKRIKLKNKRVMIGRDAKNDIDINFIRLKYPNEPDNNCNHKEVNGRRVLTNISLTPAAAVALYYLLHSTLTLLDVENFKLNIKNKK